MEYSASVSALWYWWEITEWIYFRLHYPPERHNPPPISRVRPSWPTFLVFADCLHSSSIILIAIMFVCTRSYFRRGQQQPICKQLRHSVSFWRVCPSSLFFLLLLLREHLNLESRMEMRRRLLLSGPTRHHPFRKGLAWRFPLSTAHRRHAPDIWRIEAAARHVTGKTRACPPLQLANHSQHIIPMAEKKQEEKSRRGHGRVVHFSIKIKIFCKPWTLCLQDADLFGCNLSIYNFLDCSRKKSATVFSMQNPREWKKKSE